MSVLEFDQVAIKVASGFNLLKAEDYLQMPIAERVKLITSGKVQFLSSGQPIPVKTAVQSISQAG